MKKETTILAILLSVLLSACSSFTVDENTLILKVNRVRSTKVWLEIYPQTNEFYYVYDYVKASEYEQYSSDRRFIEHHFKDLQYITDEINSFLQESGYEPTTLEELCFYRGAAGYLLDNLEPETDYIVFAYCINSKNKPIHTLLKTPFTTGSKPTSDITFQIEIAGRDTVRITPSNNDSYYWDIVSKPSVYAYYELPMTDTTDYDFLLADVWFNGVLDLNYEWGFEITDTGIVEVGLSSLINGTLNDGDTFFVGCVGFTTEETTETTRYRIIYHSQVPSTVEPLPGLEDIDLDNDDDEDDNGPRNTRLKTIERHLRHKLPVLYR